MLDCAQQITATDLKTVAETLSTQLDNNQTLEPRVVHDLMDQHTGTNTWTWREAYDACEAATQLFLKRWLKAMQEHATTGSDTEQVANSKMLTMIQNLEGMLPSQSWRSEEQNALQQFSTPLPYAWLVGLAARLTDKSVVLEPSAGTGALAMQAYIAGATLHLNEIAPRRADILAWLFADSAITNHHGAYIHAQMHKTIAPDTILMNPPFSADVNKRTSRSMDETVKHFHSAFHLLEEGGRAVIITGGNMTAKRLIKGLDNANPRLSAVVDGRIFQRQGTNFATALHVIDKSPDTNALEKHEVDSMTGLLSVIQEHCPERSIVSESPEPAPTSPAAESSQGSAVVTDLFTGEEVSTPNLASTTSLSTISASPVEPLSYEENPTPPINSKQTSAVFQAWQPGAIHIPQASPHPSTLAESIAMTSIRPPMPSYKPQLPTALITEGVLSAAQLETVVHAGEAHEVILPQHFYLDKDKGDDMLFKCEEEDEGFQLRKGYFLGDGTGAGKGRQVAGIILDNWHQQRRKAVWFSKSDKLIEDARRDWGAVGGNPSQIVPLSKYKQGTKIALSEGIIFATYATLRSGERQGKASRLDQLVQWLGDDFDGCLIFDEAHALGNAAGGEKTVLGTKKPSQQGKAGLGIQNRLPDARVVYVSATGASSINSLAYANRLGLWSQPEIPFVDRVAFVKAMTEGGVAAAEIVARDLKAMGLYTARSLSYEGVEVDILNTPLNEQQHQIYDKWAGAFQVIHKNLEAALESTGIVSDEGETRNKNAKAAARSAFESSKQRFFCHLLTGMKCPMLFKAIDADLEAGHSVVIQIVSTGEAVMERCLERIHPSEWDDLSVDITPRDTVLDYLENAFPVQMQVEYEDEEGNILSKPMFNEDGKPVFDPLALEARDKMIKKLATLPPIPSALDQLIWHYGKDKIAEITGRGRRIVRHEDGRLAVEKRSASAGLTEAVSFMDDEKQILVFSEAGGTGRSYHADATVKNQRRRIHYLLEPGWRADNAIQGLGRSNRTGQVIPPVFRPVSTDVKGEIRFIATIARRLDTLGAITRGQRASVNQGLFREEDNLESPYARAALKHFYQDLYRGNLESIEIKEFEDITGLNLVYEGQLREELPPMHTFLNRLLALPIATQNALFGELEARISSRIEIAIQNGTYELGVETITAEHLTLSEVEEIEGGLKLCTIEAKDRIIAKSFEDLKAIAEKATAPKWCQNERSKKVALVVGTTSLFTEDGGVTPRHELIRPDKRERMTHGQFEESNWQKVSLKTFKALWEQECEDMPEFYTSTIRLVTGILLPVWDKLPKEAPRVRRLTTDSGEILLGRQLNEAQLNDFRKSMGLDIVQPEPDELFDRLMDGGDPVSLIDDFRLVSRKVYGAPKIELLGDIHEEEDRLKDMRCVVEWQRYQMRVFIPDIACLKAVLQAWPVE